MKPFRVIKKLDCANDSNKDVALKFDAGKVRSEKYGEATLSGHLLLMNRHGLFPAVNVEEIEKRAFGWLTEIGLEEYHVDMSERNNVPALIACSAPATDPHNLGLYYKVSVVFYLVDELVLKLHRQMANNRHQHQQDMLTVANLLISIVENKGVCNSPEVAASPNPTLKATCKGLSHVCGDCAERMSADEYTNFAQQVIDYIRVNKWVREFAGLPYTKNDYQFVRCFSIGAGPLMYTICLANDIRLPREIIIHPLFQKYYRNTLLHISLFNDIISVQKEIDDNEAENYVLVKCRKYSLQESICKTEKAINELLIELKKDEIKLKLYFPQDRSLEKYTEMVNYAIDGYMYHYQYFPRRYGHIKFESYVVEYAEDCEYNINWLENMSKIETETMKEPVLRLESKNGAIILSPLSPPIASHSASKAA